MNTNKRLITIVASALMVFAFALFVHADPAFADDPPQTTIGGVVYSLQDDGTATVTGCTEDLQGETKIKTTITHNGTTYTVTTIGASAFENCPESVSIVIPASVEIIGEDAFWGSMANITFESNSKLKTICSDAFEGCPESVSIEIPASVETIGEYAFAFSEASITFESNSKLKTICNNAFYGARGVRDITFPASLTSIGAEAFVSSGITSVTFEKGSQLKAIEADTFNTATELKNVTIPASVSAIGYHAFNIVSAECIIHYAGTWDEWENNVKKHEEWAGTPEPTVHFATAQVVTEATPEGNGEVRYTCPECSDWSYSDYTYYPPNTTLPDVDLSDNGIPVLSIDIDPEEYQKVVESGDHSYRSAGGTISITVPEGYTGDYGDVQLPSQENLQLEYLRGRGNSTWMDAKKPFKFKLDKSTDLLGMGANKHWVLLASAFDGTMLRNRVVGYMGRQLGLDFTPMYTPVDLVVNGQYRGSYILAHQVRIGKTRVNIKELKPTDTAEPEVTGGYLLQYAPYGDEGEQNIFMTKRGSSFAADNPVFESEDEEDELGAPEQRDYISSYLQQVEDAVYGEGFKDENGVPYTDLMDVRAAAAYWMIQEFTRNTDAFGTPSTYLYKDRGGKLCWGPLWDSDLTFDTLTGTEGFNHCDMDWLDYLRTYDPVYQKELKQVWKEYDPLITQIIQEGGLLDQYAAELQKSWDDNKALAEAENWAEESFFEEDYESLEAELSKLREFITTRQEWFRGHIDTDLTKACCKITLMADGEILGTLYARNGYSLGATFARMEMTGQSLPPFGKEGYVADGWNDENGNPVNEGESINGDMTISVRYVPEADAIFADGLFFAQYEVFLDINTEDWRADYTITPQNAQEKSIIWSTSDEEVAGVDEKGQVTFNSVGDVTITGKLRSGAKKSCLLHIRNKEDVPTGPVRNLIPESDSLTLKPGEYGQNPLTLDPNTDFVVLYYQSSDEDVAEVDDVGVIHAISPGTCLITVTEEDSEVETSFPVVVEDNSGEVAGRKAQLTEYVTAASRDLATGKYTADTVKALKQRIAEANTVLDDTSATVRDIDIAQVRLLRAWRLLEPVDQAAEEADRVLHEEVNALAKELIDISEKVKPAVYTTASYKTLSTAIAKAKQLLADDTSTAQQLREARTQLLKARQVLKKKSANTLKVKGKTVNLKAKKLKKKAQTVKRAKAVTVSKPRGTVKYTLSSVSKAKFKKYFKVSAKTGKITMKKGLKKGTYTVKIKVSAAGNGNYLPAAKSAKVIVKVK